MWTFGQTKKAGKTKKEDTKADPESMKSPTTAPQTAKERLKEKFQKRTPTKAEKPTPASPPKKEMR